MSGHTKGPWTYEEHGGSFYVFGPDQAMIADNNDEDGNVPKEATTGVRGSGAPKHSVDRIIAPSHFHSKSNSLPAKGH